MSLQVLVIKLDTFGMRIHDAKSLSADADGTHFVITEEDGSVTNLNKDRYMVTILR